MVEERPGKACPALVEGPGSAASGEPGTSAPVFAAGPSFFANGFKTRGPATTKPAPAPTPAASAPSLSLCLYPDALPHSPPSPLSRYVPSLNPCHPERRILPRRIHFILIPTLVAKEDSYIHMHRYNKSMHINILRRLVHLRGCRNLLNHRLFIPLGVPRTRARRGKQSQGFFP